MQRLVDAARTQFAARGYGTATTRDIAKAADVSETLLFRYFGSKAGLFDHVVFTPFDDIARQFLTPSSQPGAHPPAREIIAAFLSFLEQNRDVVLTLAARGTDDTADEHSLHRQWQMQRHYAQGAALVRDRYKKTGETPAVPPDLAARLGFGMVLATSLFGDWLFPEGMPPRDGLAQAIDLLLTNIFALAPPE